MVVNGRKETATCARDLTRPNIVAKIPKGATGQCGGKPEMMALTVLVDKRQVQPMDLISRPGTGWATSNSFAVIAVIVSQSINIL